MQKMYFEGCEIRLLDVLEEVARRYHKRLGPVEYDFDWVDNKDKTKIWGIKIRYPKYKYLRWLEFGVDYTIKSIDDDTTPIEYEGYYFLKDKALNDFFDEMVKPINQWYQSLPDVDTREIDYGF